MRRVLTVRFWALGSIRLGRTAGLLFRNVGGKQHRILRRNRRGLPALCLRLKCPGIGNPPRLVLRALVPMGLRVCKWSITVTGLGGLWLVAGRFTSNGSLRLGFWISAHRWV